MSTADKAYLFILAVAAVVCYLVVDTLTSAGAAVGLH